MTNVVATNEMVVASTKDCKNPRSELTTIDLALLLVSTDDSMLYCAGDKNMLHITTLILLCLLLFAADVQAARLFWRNCAVVCVPVSSDYGPFPAML